jgi:hypothetical protein
VVKNLILITSEAERERAVAWVFSAKPGSRVILEEPQHSSEGNARMWALLTRLSEELEWHGQHYSPGMWKDFFMHAFKGVVWMPAENGGYVPVGRGTGELTAAERREFIRLIEEFGARHGVDFGLPREADGNRTRP